MKWFTKSCFTFCLTILICNPAFSAETGVFGGTWTEKGYPIKGSWQIVERDAHKYIVFDKTFKTKKGPDLKVYLSKTTIEDIDGDKVAQSSVKISSLQSNKGSQEYKIPDNINLEDYSSLLIHCEAYSHLWGGSALEN